MIKNIHRQLSSKASIEDFQQELSSKISIIIAAAT